MSIFIPRFSRLLVSSKILASVDEFPLKIHGENSSLYYINMSLKIEAEVKVESEPCVLAWDDKLFVGTEDGSIKVFDDKLTPESSWSAHAVQVFTLAAAGGRVYSSSNDGGVRIWTAKGDKVAELPQNAEGDVVALHVFGTDLYTGDESGNVKVYSNNTLKAMYNVLEEVKDLQFCPPYLYTARDLYITVTEIKPEESKTRFVTRHSMEGRAPLRISGDKLIALARGGNNLKLHYATAENEFKLIHEVKVSDMIVTSLAVNGDFVYTGGWDGHIRRWRITDNQLAEAGDINFGTCINALVAGPDVVYAAITGGRLISVKPV